MDKLRFNSYAKKCIQGHSSPIGFLPGRCDKGEMQVKLGLKIVTRLIELLFKIDYYSRVHIKTLYYCKDKAII